METGFTDLKRSWHWRGRKWLAGFVVGMWLGVLVGAGVAVKYDFANKWTIVHLVVMLIVGIVVVWLGQLIEGRPPKDRSSP